jgi:transposase
MDNAAFHKNEDLRTMVEKAGHIIEYLPPYSPDLNSIEPKWSQAKSRRRKYHCDIDTLLSQIWEKNPALAVRCFNI